MPEFTMLLSSLSLINYRNYESQTCEFSPGVNLLIGANAQGKTNLVEAVYYLSIGRTYRQVKDEQLIRWGQDGFAIKGAVSNLSGTTDIEISYRNDRRPGKEMTAGGLQRSSWGEISGLVTTVLFTPDSLSIIKESPRERRSFLDRDIGQISRVYIDDLLRYRRVLIQRNTLLKRLGSASYTSDEKRERLIEWDRQLIHYGSRIIEKRLSFMEKMAPMVRLTHRRLTGGKETPDLRYRFGGQGDTDRKSVSTPEGIRGLLGEMRERTMARDLQYRSTHWGPHRDDMELSINGFDIKKYGSQGQQRTGVLALKLAEIEVFRGESGEYPILLLDDVLSELDGDRRRQLLEYISEKRLQCLVTATGMRGMGIQPHRETKAFNVKDGRICEMTDFHV